MKCGAVNSGINVETFRKIILPPIISIYPDEADSKTLQKFGTLSARQQRHHIVEGTNTD